MVDIFLMGTVGNSQWREPIKRACASLGISCFDPVVPVWNEEAKRREAEALKSARVIVMAITSDTASIASLAESGWAAMSAIMRRQAYGLYIDPVFGDEAELQTNTGQTGFGGWLLDTFLGGRERTQTKKADTLEDSSRRARKLVISHVTKLKSQFPDSNIYLAGTLDALQNWAIRTAKQLTQVKPGGRQQG